MDKVKIIHCSDFHLDTPFSDLDKITAEKRKEDIRETFSNIIRLTVEEKIHILVMSGDIFDNSTVSYETISLMKRSFEKIPEVRIFISPGNHDSYNKNSYYKSVQWPSNVHIFKNYLEKVEITEINVSVYGYGFGTSYERESLLRNFQVEDHEKINLMVLHGEVLRGNSPSDYNPIREEEISKSGLDYLALGHVHSFSGINRTGVSYWAYPGCPEGRGFDELGPKGVILGVIGKGYVNLNFVETSKRRHEIIEVDISNSENYEDIVVKIREKLGLHKISNDIAEIYEKLQRDIYKIILKGQVDREFIINAEILKEKLKGLFYHLKLMDCSEVKIDYEVLAKEYNIKGVFVNKMLYLINSAEDEAEKENLKVALKMGLDALDLREVKAK